jgi:hypothetical protein
MLLCAEAEGSLGIKHKPRQRAPLHDTSNPQWPHQSPSPMVGGMSGITFGSGSSALQYAQAGISRGMAGLDRDAQTIAQATVSDGGDSSAVTGALVDSQQQALNVEVNAKALSITNQTLGTLLDVMA